ncbi:Clp protease, partial [Nocardia panacis]
GARPLRRTIQREIEDQLSEKILFGEIGPGQVITVDVEGWNGEGSGEDAKFVFAGKAKLTKPEPVEDKPVAALAGDTAAAAE